MGLDENIGVLEKISFSVTRFINAIGVFFLAVMMIIITLDVILRYFFNSPIDGSLELIRFVLVLTVLLAIPYTTVRKQHVAIDIVTSKLSEKTRYRLESLMVFIAIILTSLVIWRSIKYAMLKHQTGEMSTILHMLIASVHIRNH